MEVIWNIKLETVNQFWVLRRIDDLERKAKANNMSHIVKRATLENKKIEISVSLISKCATVVEFNKKQFDSNVSKVKAKLNKKRRSA